MNAPPHLCLWQPGRKRRYCSIDRRHNYYYCYYYNYYMSTRVFIFCWCSTKARRFRFNNLAWGGDSDRRQIYHSLCNNIPSFQNWITYYPLHSPSSSITWPMGYILTVSWAILWLLNASYDHISSGNNSSSPVMIVIIITTSTTTTSSDSLESIGSQGSGH